MYIRENPIRIGIGRQATPMRRRAKIKTPKNAIEAATCPDGNEWYLVLKRGPPHRSSDFTEGRARGNVRLITWPAMPAIAIASSIDKKMRVHFLLPRHQAIPARRNPSATCEGQSPNRLTLCMKLRIARF